MKIAIPLSGGNLSQHFGHCEQFALFDIEDKKVKDKQVLSPPAHEPGVLPQWLHEQGATLIITGGMGRRAQDLFNQAGIEVVCGAMSQTPEQIVEQYLRGELETGANICDH